MQTQVFSPCKNYTLPKQSSKRNPKDFFQDIIINSITKSQVPTYTSPKYHLSKILI
jgi:hypothetical protein